MTKCKACGQEMLKAQTCTANKEIKLTDGSKMPGVPFKGPNIKDLEDSLGSLKNSKIPENVKQKMIKNIENNIELMKSGPKVAALCHDCGVRDGGFHHPGCDSEICPRCGGQLITCGCLNDSRGKEK